MAAAAAAAAAARARRRKVPRPELRETQGGGGSCREIGSDAIVRTGLALLCHNLRWKRVDGRGDMRQTDWCVGRIGRPKPHWTMAPWLPPGAAAEAVAAEMRDPGDGSGPCLDTDADGRVAAIVIRRAARETGAERRGDAGRELAPSVDPGRQPSQKGPEPDQVPPVPARHSSSMTLCSAWHSAMTKLKGRAEWIYQPALLPPSSSRRECFKAGFAHMAEQPTPTRLNCSTSRPSAAR
eukprot:266719-Chlamydomonas_euryale.AAC.6